MTGELRPGLRLASDEDPTWRLWSALPHEWRDPIIGPGVANWKQVSENNE